MKSNSNKIVKRFLICWIIAVSVMLAGIVTYAAYTNLNSVKRVVSTQGSRGLAFSSNYLNATDIQSDVYSLKSIPFSESGDTVAFEINVCNYVHNDPSKVNENDITYSLTLTLITPNGTPITENYLGLSVVDGDTNQNFYNGICTLPARILKGGIKSVNTYRVIVPRQFIDTVNIEAVAEPTGNSAPYTDNKKLGRVFTFSAYNAASTTWTGSFSETTTEGYDGFNYVIKGQGKGTVTLTYDNANLEISKIFLDRNGLTSKSENGKTTVTIYVNSNNISRYEIQFYKTENGAYPDMSTVNGYIEFSFSES